MSTNQENPTLKRLEEQIDWYDKKSALNQSRFKGIKIIELVAAALIPLFLNEYPACCGWDGQETDLATNRA